MSKNAPEKNYNQYELVLAMTQYIRQNPDADLSLKLKQCTHQSEQVKLFAAFI